MTKPEKHEGVASRVAGLQRVSLLYDAGGAWREICRALPEGFGGGWMEIPSPGLEANGWIVALLDVRASLLRVGTLGAAWATFEPEEHVQLWVPSKIEVPEGVLVQVELWEAS